MKLKKQEIIEILKKEISDLTLTPGSLLSEATLTDRFHLSRTPIRDILKQLEKEGYIKIYPQKGSIVSFVDLHSVEQIIYLRTTLEKDIFKNLKNNFTIAMSHQLMSIIKSQEACIQEDDTFHTFLKYDDLFHRTCFKLIGREFLWDLIQHFNVHYLRYRNLNMRNESKLSVLLGEHKTLLSYLQGKEDPEFDIDKHITHHLQSDLNSFEFIEKFESYILLDEN